MNTFYQMWGVLTPEEARQKIDEQRQEALAKMREDGITEPRNLEEQALLLIGKDIYETLIKAIPRSNGDGNVRICQPLSSNDYPSVSFMTTTTSATVSKGFPWEASTN